MSPFPASAQTPLFGETLTLTASPRSPKPGDSVTIRAESFAIDLNRSVMTWTVNGKVVARERGKVELETAAGKGGTALVVSASAEAPGGVVEGDLTIRPASVELIFEADSYVPPFYRGKALSGPDASLTVFAIPHLVDESGKEIPPGNLVYTWRQDNRVLGDLSGYGKRSLKTKGGVFGRSTRLSVVAATTGGGLSAEESVVVTPVDLFVRLYEKDPLRGVRFERSFTGSFTMREKEVTLAAYPFFFSVRDTYDPDVGFIWAVDGDPVRNSGVAANLLTLRQTAEGEGSAAVSIQVTNSEEILQSARESLTITFGE